MEERPTVEDEAITDEEHNKKRRTETSSDPQSSKQTSSHRIAATGSRVPAAVTSFEALSESYKVPSLLLRNIATSGYVRPTEIQSQGVPILLENRDLAAVAPTGSGKTLAYLLPIFSLLKSPISARDAQNEERGVGARALILSPTRELASQIYNECLKLAQGRKWRIVLYGKATGSTLAEKDVRDKIGASSASLSNIMGIDDRMHLNADIIISTPLRLVSALQEDKIDLDNIRHLILDEADRLLDTNFLTQTEELIAACTHPKLQKAVFSATLPTNVESVAKSLLFDPIRVVVGLKDSASLHVTQTLTYVGNETGKLHALNQLLANGPPLPLLIFVQSRERAIELHEELIYDDLTVDILHSGMTAKQRDESVTRMRNGETWIMVCTDVMARGMDFGGVKGVVNYDFPNSVQTYVHRIGRTGRAGRSGQAFTYFTDADAPFVKAIANVINQSNIQQTAFSASKPDIAMEDAIQPPTSTIPEWMLKLPKPSKMKKRQLLKKPVERKSVGVVAGRNVGKKEAIRKRQMIEASKRRKAQVKGGEAVNDNGESWTGID
ncbi:RNA-dependent ATPase rok1 [Tulasnella sp. 418]|nr:RNA-dependent ATPase rok1 [Tulasnella sp. 418]